MGCKKEKPDVVTTNLQPTLTIPKLSTIDSALLHARALYLWYNQIPLPLVTNGFTDPGALMESIRQYSIESGFSAPVDRWSFAMKKTEWDKLSSGISANFSNSNPDLSVLVRCDDFVYHFLHFGWYSCSHFDFL